MKYLRAGAVVLSIWCALNMVVAALVTGITLARGAAPALRLVMPAAEIGHIDPRALAVVNAQAAIANPCIIVICALALVLVFRGILAGTRWPLVALATTLPPLQLFGFISDAFLGGRNLAANSLSAILLLLGLGLLGYGRQHAHKGD